MVNKWNKESYATVKSGILYILQQISLPVSQGTQTTQLKDAKI